MDFPTRVIKCKESGRHVGTDRCSVAVWEVEDVRIDVRESCLVLVYRATTVVDISETIPVTGHPLEVRILSALIGRWPSVRVTG